MKITRIVAVSLTAALAFGCRYDAPEETVDTPDPTPEPCTVDCEVIDPAVSYAVLIKDEATTEAGEMRFKLDAAQASGELSVNIKVDASEPKLSYIGLYGTSTSTDDALVDLKMGGINSDYADDATDGYAVIKLRSKKIADVKQPDVDTALEYPADTWVNVSIKWDAGNVTIALFDQATGDAIGSAETYPMQNVVDVQNIIFKISDTSGMTTAASPYLVDDIVVYSDLAQTTKTLSEAFNSVSVPTSVYSTKGTTNSKLFLDSTTAHLIERFFYPSTSLFIQYYLLHLVSNNLYFKFIFPATYTWQRLFLVVTPHKQFKIHIAQSKSAALQVQH